MEFSGVCIWFNPWNFHRDLLGLLIHLLSIHIMTSGVLSILGCMRTS